MDDDETDDGGKSTFHLAHGVTVEVLEYLDEVAVGLLFQGAPLGILDEPLGSA